MIDPVAWKPLAAKLDLSEEEIRAALHESFKIGKQTGIATSCLRLYPTRPESFVGGRPSKENLPFEQSSR